MIRSIFQPTPMPATQNRKLTPLLFGDTFSTDMVDICVGPSKKQYRVHKAILCTKVDYFQKMFTNAFKETVDQAATLPEVDIAVLICFSSGFVEEVTTSLSKSLRTLVPLLIIGFQDFDSAE